MIERQLALLKSSGLLRVRLQQTCALQKIDTTKKEMKHDQLTMLRSVGIFEVQMYADRSIRVLQVRSRLKQPRLHNNPIFRMLYFLSFLLTVEEE